MIAIGKENFGRFLDGAHAIDEHFRTAPLPQKPADAAWPSRLLSPRHFSAIPAAP